ncbi:MAG: hypothetical protein C9356_08130 [Oleiphilus sp.]|nr:MAG: hypothetical protein C9356_08130 [Oleiphilus sp.]
MKKLHFIISLLLFVSMAAFVQAEPVSDDTLDKLLILSGTDAQAKDAAASASMMFSQSPLGQAKSEKIQRFQATVMDYNTLIDGASQSLKSALTEAQASKLIDWYESNFGNRIAQAEEAGSSPQAMQMAMQNAQTLLADKDRVAMANRMMALMDSTKESIDMQKALTRAIFAGMSTMQSPDKPVDLAGIDAMITAQIEGATAQIEQQMRIVILNMYKDFSLQELESYYQVLGRPEMKAFNQAGAQGMVNVMSKALEDFVAEDTKKS